jgi:ParB family transcriptional regulator, chromosome partitioning protein
MTNTAAANAGHSGEKEKEKPAEKMEKRRALGRGLESLLPGPRVVAAVPALTHPSPPFAKDAKDGAPRSLAYDDHAGAENTVGVIQAVAEEAVPLADSVIGAAAELRSAGQPGAAVPTRAPDEGITIFAQAESRVPGNLVVNLAMADIDKNPFQTRYVHKDDALQELADSIKANGLLQPIVVRPAEEDGRYILILGERRLHASKMAGRETIPAIVRRVSEQQAAEMTIIENLQRQDLSALEQAEAFRVLSEEFKLTQSQIGERIGLSRESVANYMRLLRLPESTMKFLAEGDISFATAKELLKLEDKDLIAETATRIVERGMTFDQVERLVWQMIGVLDPVPGMPGQEKKKSGARWVDPNVRAAQTELERLLGLKIRIRDRKGRGKIVIEYHTVDDYERVVGMLRGTKG